MRFLFLVFILFSTQPLHAAIESRKFDNPQYEQRYYQMIDKLRCLVCQNQNLADSNSDLARDLRDKTYDMIKSGATDAEISEFMVARYGQFVLYEPQVNRYTLVLWGAPIIFAFIGIIVFLRIARNKSSSDTPGIDEDLIVRARAHLNDKNS